MRTLRRFPLVTLFAVISTFLISCGNQLPEPNSSKNELKNQINELMMIAQAESEGALPSEPESDGFQWPPDIEPCMVDLNQDGDVNLSDFVGFVGQYFMGDQNEDGEVNCEDVRIGKPNEPCIDFWVDEQFNVSDLQIFSANLGLIPDDIDCNTDTHDNDGLTIYEEARIHTDPTDPDTDSDGFEDGFEFNEGSDPLNPESFPVNFTAFDQIGSNEYDHYYYTAIDADGNVYMAGEARGPVNGNYHQGESDVILAKYDNLGNRLWLVQYGSEGNDNMDEFAGGVFVDSYGFIFLVGWTNGLVFDGISTGGRNVGFITKLDTDGNRLGTVFIDLSDSSTTIHAAAIDESNNIFVVGRSSPDGEFLAKFSMGMGYQWHVMLSDGVPVTPTGIEVLGTVVYVTGYNYGSLHGQPNLGGQDIFLSNYSSIEGSRSWTRQFGTEEDDTSIGVELDENYNAYVLGRIGGSIGNYNMSVYARGPTAAPLWANLLLSPNTHDGPSAIAYDGEDGIYITGSTENGYDGVEGFGGRDAFLMKLSKHDGTKTDPTVLAGTTEWDYCNDIDFTGSGKIVAACSTGGSFDGFVNSGSNDAAFLIFQAID